MYNSITVSYAPIVLFVYNRLEHTKKTIEALKRNYGAQDSILYIYSDGPQKSATGSVEAVRNYIRQVEGFKDIKIIFRENNMGLAASVISGVTEVVNRHGRIIVIEDDLVTSEYFLMYMNEALQKYEECSKVYAVTGYSYFDRGNKKLPETYFARLTESWTWATWKDRWKYFDPEATGWQELMQNSSLSKAFDYDNSFGFTDMLYQQMELKKIDSWAVRWAYSMFRQDGLTLYPNKPLCINIGFDGTGVHCGESEGGRKIELQTEAVRYWPRDISELPETKKQICREMARQKKKNIINRGKYYSMHPIKAVIRLKRKWKM